MNAYLVLAHEDVDMLNILISRLVSTGLVFVHLDLGCSIQLEEVVNGPRIYISKVMKIKWGGWSIVQATRLLANQAIAAGAKRLTLLSGLSYPLVSDDKLSALAISDADIFEAQLVDLNSIGKSFKRRFTSRHLEFKLGNSLFARIVRRASREIHSKLPSLDPERELSPLKLTLGSQWWSVSTATYTSALEVLKTFPKIERYFRHIECSDESFFGTLFARVSQNHNNLGTTYVQWGGDGRPLVLAQVDPSVSEKYFFARKFSSLNFPIIQ